MRRYLLIGTAAALLAIPALAAGRATTTITVSPNNTNRFGPNSVTTNVGAGAIHWAWGADPHGNNFAPHNVQQDNNLFSSGAPVKSKPAGYTITPSAGSFHYYCTLHGNPGTNLGMVGTIHIRPAVFNKTASSFGVRWSPGTNQTGNAFDVRYRVDGGAWKTWQNHVTAAYAVFGANNSPVHVGPGHTYEVQARSEKLSDLSKPSGWSPSAKVTT
jgi:plastocyanin